MNYFIDLGCLFNNDYYGFYNNCLYVTLKHKSCIKKL